MRPRDEPVSLLSLGLTWASRVSVVGAEFVVPTLAGVLLDRWWHSSPAATLAGCALGFAVGMAHTLRIAREGTRGA